jgi:hypothetical protein
MGEEWRSRWSFVGWLRGRESAAAEALVEGPQEDKGDGQGYRTKGAR